MNVPFVAGGLLLLVFAGVGWPTARMLGRSRSWAVAITPASTGVAVAAVVAVSVLTRTSMVPWLLLIAALGWAGLLRRRQKGGLSAEADVSEVGVVIVAVLVAVLPVLLVDIPATENDARYLWWFHAAWFRGGGAVARAAIGDTRFTVSHPRYPPLVPGVIAAVWHLGRAYDRETALRITQLLTAAGVATTAFFASTTFRLGRRGSMVAAALVAVICWGAGPTLGLNGTVDLTWAVFFAPTTLLLLAGPTDRRTVRVAALLAAAAGLVKLEAQVASMLLVAFTFARAGRAWRQALPVAVAVFAAIATWSLVPAIAHAPTERRAGLFDLLDVFKIGSDMNSRLMTSLSDLAGLLGPLIGLSALGIVLVVAASRFSGTPLRQPGLLSLLGLSAAYLFVIGLIFAGGDEEIHRYLSEAAYRTVVVVRILVLLDVVLAVVAASRALGVFPPPARDQRPTPTPLMS